jgi:peptidyl-prolyl cis-trans isomerase D
LQPEKKLEYMAAIGQIRKHYGLLVAIIGIALAAFILGDLFKSTPQSSVTIGSVNGEEISYKDFSIEVEDAKEVEKNNSQKLQLTSSEVFRIQQTVWSRKVREIIMDEEFEDLGLVVTSEELGELVQGENPHRYILQYFKDPQTNEYNRNMILQYLQSLDQMPRENQLQWLDFEKAIKDDQLNTKFNDLVSKAFYLPESFGRLADQHKNSEIDVQFVAQRYTTVSDDEVEVTDEDFEAYYKENKEDFKQEETRDIEYVVFDVKASPEDRENQKNEFDEYYEELRSIPLDEASIYVNTVSDIKYQDKWYKKGELPLQIEEQMFNDQIGVTVNPYLSNNAYHTARLLAREDRPDSLKASHILISYAGATRASADVTRIKPNAKSLADSLLKIVEKRPSSIETLTAQFSDDPAVAENKGQYDWFPDGQMVPEFNQAVLDNDKNEVVLVETVFGFHIIRVDGKKDFNEKAKVAMIERSIEPSSETFQKAYVKASEFASRCKTENYSDVADDMGLSIRNVEDLSAMQENIPGQTQAREIVRWAFTPEIETGDMKLFDMGRSYIVSLLVDIKDDEYKDLESVKATITPAVTNLKKAEIIMEKISGSANKEDLNKLAAELNTEVETGTLKFESNTFMSYGVEPEVIGSIMSLEENEILGPIKGKTAVYVVKAQALKPSPEKSDYRILDKQMSNRFKSNVNLRLYRAMEEEADIEDNRHLFY